MQRENVTIGDTWLEPEELCYPHGGMTRRAKAICEDGKLRVVKCGIPDTFFSIPAKLGAAKGFVSSEESGFHFTAYKPLAPVAGFDRNGNLVR